jgi:hypothetical protein
MGTLVVKLTIDELFDLNDIPPQLPIRGVPDLRSSEVNKQLEDFYNFKYAHALDKLFETSWYTTLGFATLTADHKLHEFAVQCMEEMRAKPASYGQTAPMPTLASLEARLVWSLAAMPRVHHHHNTNNTSPSLITATSGYHRTPPHRSLLGCFSSTSGSCCCSGYGWRPGCQIYTASLLALPWQVHVAP